MDGTFHEVTGGIDHAVNLDGGGQIHLGRDNSGNRPFVGDLDDVAIFDEALSLAELDAIAADGVIPDLNLYSFWVADPVLGIHPSQRDFTADPDGDQLANGIEAWFGTSPGHFSTSMTGVSSDGMVSTFTHPVNPDPPTDLSATYEWSRDLMGWYAGDGLAGPAGGPTVSIEAVPSGVTATVTATAGSPLDLLFFRIRIAKD